MNSTRHKKSIAPPRRGVAMIMVIAFYAVAIALVGVWVRSALSHQRQVQRWHERTQATWLAEAGVRRAIARLATGNGYAGESWQIPAAEFGGNQPAEVTIRTDKSENAVKVTATCDYPAGTQRHVRITKTHEFKPPISAPLPGESS